MIRSLIPFSELTRGNRSPEFAVARRPITTQGRTFEIGEKLPSGVFSSSIRIRQLYEQRLLVPVVPPKGSKQEAREKFQREQHGSKSRPHAASKNTQSTRTVSAPVVVVSAVVTPSTPVVVVTAIPDVSSAVPVDPHPNLPPSSQSPSPSRPPMKKAAYQPARRNR